MAREVCVNDDVFCRCQSCIDSMVNGGSCSHCFCCISGEKAMDVCESWKNNGNLISEI